MLTVFFLDEDSEKSDREDAYEQGRRDEEVYESDNGDGGW